MNDRNFPSANDSIYVRNSRYFDTIFYNINECSYLSIAQEARAYTETNFFFLFYLFFRAHVFSSRRNTKSRRKTGKRDEKRGIPKSLCSYDERVRKIRPPKIVGAREQLIRALTQMAPSIMGRKTLMNASCPDRKTEKGIARRSFLRGCH